MKKLRHYTHEADLPEGIRAKDTISGALTELYFVRNPEERKIDPAAKRRAAAFGREHQAAGSWAYYPWRNVAVHVPPAEIYFELRTARNRNLITEEEQCAYREAVVGIAGLSVGSAVVSALVATGGPRRLKIADPDTIEITNLNRMRATLLDVGESKTSVAAHGVWELDPFAEIELFPRGVGKRELAKFVTGAPRLSLCVDEMDDIAMKIALRFFCRAERVPVVMATDNGDSVIIDVERFDLEPRRPIFHGAVRLPRQKHGALTREQFITLSSEIIDPAFFTPRQQESILLIGKTLAGIPQIGTAASIAGAAVAYAVRQIACGATLPSGRYVLGCEPTFTTDYESRALRAVRARATRHFRKSLGLGD